MNFFRQQPSGESYTAGVVAWVSCKSFVHEREFVSKTPSRASGVAHSIESSQP